LSRIRTSETPDCAATRIGCLESCKQEHKITY
jgi:hypothetical protein